MNCLPDFNEDETSARIAIHIGDTSTNYLAPNSAVKALKSALRDREILNGPFIAFRSLSRTILVNADLIDKMVITDHHLSRTYNETNRAMAELDDNDDDLWVIYANGAFDTFIVDECLEHISDQVLTIIDNEETRSHLHIPDINDAETLIRWNRIAILEVPTQRVIDFIRNR